MWYKNPAWYALGISFVAFVISLYTFTLQKETFKSQVQRDLIVQAIEINERFAKYKISSPYSLYFGIKKEDADGIEEFSAKTAMVLNIINFLKNAYENKETLGKEAIDDYEKWATTIVRPWIEDREEADEAKKKIFKLAMKSEDLMGKDFHNWLGKILPIL